MASVPDPPPGGLDWQWHTKRFPVPHDDCVAKLGWAKYQGYMYFKRDISCNKAKFWFRMELYVQRGQTGVIGPALVDCAAPPDYYGCSKRNGIANPSGTQTWYISFKASVNNTGEYVWVPRWVVYA